VEAALALGATPGRVLVRHLLPNLLGPLLVQASLAFAAALLAEAALSYLGLGIQPPDPSLGRMLKEAQSFLPLSPYPALVPGLALSLAVLGFNLLGDGLRDYLDPRR
jgi:peptide/nickel transport system permease protein